VVVDWVHMCQGGAHWRAAANTVTSQCFIKQGEFLSISEEPAPSVIGEEARVFYPENTGSRFLRNTGMYLSDLATSRFKSTQV
jgi:hypothetical protein